MKTEYRSNPKLQYYCINSTGKEKTWEKGVRAKSLPNEKPIDNI